MRLTCVNWNPSLLPSVTYLHVLRLPLFLCHVPFSSLSHPISKLQRCQKMSFFPFSMCKRFAVVNIISSLSRCSALPSLSIVYCFCLHRNSFMYIELIIGFFLCLNDEITHTFIEYIRTHRILWASDQHTDWERYKYNVFSDTIESRNFIAAYNSFHFLLSAVYFTFSLYCCHQRATKYATHTHRTRAKAECLLVSASPVRGLSQCECLFN